MLPQPFRGDCFLAPEDIPHAELISLFFPVIQRIFRRNLMTPTTELALRRSSRPNFPDRNHARSSRRTPNTLRRAIRAPDYKLVAERAYGVWIDILTETDPYGNAAWPLFMGHCHPDICRGDHRTDQASDPSLWNYYFYRHMPELGNKLDEICPLSRADEDDIGEFGSGQAIVKPRSSSRCITRAVRSSYRSSDRSTDERSARSR